MRCPKCGYISFDQAQQCGRCGRDLAAVADELHGTAVRVTPPFFLGGALAAAEAEPAVEPFQPATETVPGAEELSLEDAGSLAGEEEAAASAEPLTVEPETAVAGDSLAEIDLSDLVPPQEETAEPADEPGESGGLELLIDEPAPPEAEAETARANEPPAAAAGPEPAPDLTLETESAPEGEVVDLSDLLGPESPREEGAAGEEGEDLSLDFEPAALEDVSDLEPAPDLELEPALPEPETDAEETPPEIPDLGLSLERDDQDA